ncbi:C3 and PZP-like alpha-2-macroglobulin domain-containing protein 8 [Mizuhopecten yessoensis]|uniref:C3 and PZP-like alpha-2-macroglobulin domain-containing protein 8 n=1 Tax=Mizuhopecten yessoensis TaxID=6573 RepID=A0A210Q645_MIZYE|nr:C3 and PZP-like alpha-2-macroglobulin domain-containing protein 8 [Mizuhopecten yessoensis]
MVKEMHIDITVLTPRQVGHESTFQYKLLSDYGYSASGQSSLEFEVKACQDASVGLMTTNDENAPGKMYMITLGGYGNNRVLIYDSKYGNEKNYIISRVLDCDSFRHFKVEWGSGMTSVYSSPDSGLTWNLLVDWQDPSPINVNFIGVSTAVYSDGEWIIKHDITVLTPKQVGHESTFKYKLLSDYGYSASGQSSLEFEVKACQDASVGLMTTNDENAPGKMYMITLGGYGNNRVLIYDSKYGNEKNYIISSVLDCNSFRHFKVEWGSGMTSVYSSPDSGLTWNLLVDWQDPSPINVNFIGVSTAVYSDGEWIIKNGPAITPTTTIAMTTTQEETTTTTEEITTTTTTPETTTTTTNAMCSCICVLVNTTSSGCAPDDVTCIVKAVKKELTIDKQTLSSTIRKKTSANDDRPSAQAIGMVGVVFLVVFALLVFVPDFVALCRYMWSTQSKPDLP